MACSDANAVAVVDVSGERSRVEGFIPTGWYPTAVRALPSGTLVVLNGKGVRSLSQSQRAQPRQAARASARGRRRPWSMWRACRPARRRGSIRSPTTSSTPGPRQALANSPYRDAKLDDANPLPPIQHVIYIVKENRTYDQVLGDMKEGNGDPSLVLFGENVTPNHHKLAREFVLLDNFYVNSDVSADGHNWSTAAIAPDYVQKMWPNSYAGRRKLYDFEEQEPAVAAAGRLPLDQRRGGRHLHPQLRLHGQQQAQRAAPAPSRSPACATPCWPRSPTASIAASTWTTPTWSAPRSFSPNWRSTRRPATCRA